MIITYLMLLRLAVGRWGKIIFPKGNISPVAVADMEEGSRAECVTKKMRSSRSGALKKPSIFSSLIPPRESQDAAPRFVAGVLLIFAILVSVELLYLSIQRLFD